jgi:uncharacterized protein (DUF885 family)
MGTIFHFRHIKFVVRTRDHAPPHVHVLRGDCEAKIEIQSRKVIRNIGYSSTDLKRIIKFITEREDQFMEAWNEIHQTED